MSFRLSSTEAKTQVGTQLLALCEQIIADGKLDLQEIKDLRKFLNEHKENSGVRAVGYLHAMMTRITADKVVDRAEREELLTALKNIIPVAEAGPHRTAASAEPPPVQIPGLVESRPGLKLCEICGRELAVSAATCPHCGAANSESRDKTNLIYALAAVGILLLISTIGIVSYLAFSNDSDSSTALESRAREHSDSSNISSEVGREYSTSQKSSAVDATSSWNKFVRGMKSRMGRAVRDTEGLKQMEIESDEIEESSSITYPYKGLISFREHFDYGGGHFYVDHCKVTFGLKGNEWHYVEGVYKTESSNKRSDVMENYADLPWSWLKPRYGVFDIKD